MNSLPKPNLFVLLMAATMHLSSECLPLPAGQLRQSSDLDRSNSGTNTPTVNATVSSLLKTITSIVTSTSQVVNIGPDQSHLYPYSAKLEQTKTASVNDVKNKPSQTSSLSASGSKGQVKYNVQEPKKGPSYDVSSIKGASASENADKGKVSTEDYTYFYDYNGNYNDEPIVDDTPDPGLLKLTEANGCPDDRDKCKRQCQDTFHHSGYCDEAVCRCYGKFVIAGK